MKGVYILEVYKQMSIIDLLHHAKNLDQISIKCWSGVPEEFKGCFIIGETVTIFREDFTKFHEYFKNIYPNNYTFYVDSLNCFCLYCMSYLNLNKQKGVIYMEVNEKSVDLITKFFDTFQQLSEEDKKKALLVVEGMAISKGSDRPASVKSAALLPTAPMQRRDAGARSPQRLKECEDE